MKQSLKSDAGLSQPSAAKSVPAQTKPLNDLPEGTRLPNGKIVIHGGTIRARRTPKKPSNSAS